MKTRIILKGQEIVKEFSELLNPEKDVFNYIKDVYGEDISSTFQFKKTGNDWLFFPKSVVASSSEPVSSSSAGGGGGSTPSQPPPPQFVITNINAVKVDIELNDRSTKTYYLFGNQKKPSIANEETNAVPIQAEIFYARDLLKRNGDPVVTYTGQTTVQPPSIKSINKSDLTSRMKIDLPKATGVSVYFGFQDRAGIAFYNVYEKENGDNSFSLSGQVDLHNSSNVQFPIAKGVELVNGLDNTKDYVLEIGHTGSANPTIFDAGQNHPVFVGDVQINRLADSSLSVVEKVSNTAFANSSFTDNGSNNSLTGRKNFIEFFNVQTIVSDGTTDTFRIDAPTVNVRSVEIYNGRSFRELNRNIDYVTKPNSSVDIFDISVVLSFIPKENAAIRITYDVASILLQRKIELNQPVTQDGRVDRYTNLYVQNEGSYIEINANTEAARNGS